MYLGLKLLLFIIFFFASIPIFAQNGPHGGRLLIQDNLTLELSVFEQGMPPRFRAYLYEQKKLLSPKPAALIVTLKRFDGETESITFEPVDDFLQSREVIREPHSFNVTLNLSYQGHDYSWEYSSYEGRLTLAPAVLKAAHITIAVAGSATIQKNLSVVGKIMPNRDTFAPVYPRYSGIIKSMAKQLGDPVEKDELLVTIESNASLHNYPINSPITGTIVQKLATSGELAKGDTPIYEVANLNTVWVDLTLYRREAPLVKKGMSITVSGDGGHPKSISHISYISPLGIENSQTILARAVLDNKDQQWLPGMYVDAAIRIAEKSVRVAVPLSALQRWRDWEVVFVKNGDSFEASPVVLGERDDKQVEILSGLKPGQAFVADNSFFLKADLGKAGASHDD